MPVLPPVVVSLAALSGDLKAKVTEAKGELASLRDEGDKSMTGLGGAGKIAAIGVAREAYGLGSA